jgi:hypothetical protein
MFECNDKDNNLLLILGIGIIVLILLKLFYSNKNTVKKQYRNLNYENNYEDFETDAKYIKDYMPANQQSLPQAEVQAQQQAQPQTQPQAQPTQSRAAQIQGEQQRQQPQQPQQPQNRQVSISVPIIDDSIFSPYKIEFDYGDANNLNYTLDTGDIKSRQEKLNSGDLLPGKSDQKWFENPDVGIKIEDANLLSDAVQKVGVDTVGQTRKNPSYDIRGTVPCPKFQISPWNNSTTEPDYNLKSLY